jgi:drug/metabolite transporter (DMT)-like permease
VSSSLLRTTFSGLQRTPTHRALLLMSAAATMFGAMAFAAKIASARLSGPQVAMIRMAVGLLPCLLVPRWRRAAMKFQRLDLLFYRGFFGGIAVMLYFLAIEHTSAGIATLLNYTSPLWSGILSMLLLGERYSAKVLIPIPIALTGVFMVVHAHAHPGDALGFGRWELVGVLSAVASGAALTAMRAARRGENSWAVYASFCLLGFFVNAPLALMHWKNPKGREWIALAATAVLAMGAQLLLTFSLKWVDAMTVGVISQLAVIVSMALGAMFLGERIGLLAAVGAALTIGGVAGVTYVTSLSKPLATAVQLAPEA